MTDKAEIKPVRSFEMTMFAEHYQFMVHDAAADPGEVSVYWDEESRESMILIEQSLIGVGTVRHLDVPVVVDLYEEEPEEENLEQWDQVTQCSIDIPSGKLMVSGATEDYYESETIEVNPGLYGVRVYYGALDDVDDDGFEGDDFYRVALWRTDNPPEPRVLKQWDDRPRYMY